MPVDSQSPYQFRALAEPRATVLLVRRQTQVLRVRGDGTVQFVGFDAVMEAFAPLTPSARLFGRGALRPPGAFAAAAVAARAYYLETGVAPAMFAGEGAAMGCAAGQRDVASFWSCMGAARQ